ncbi:hypothetical protein AMTR_s00021p00039690 [Amborella trichopoda]|uniref:Uncharacterized protein n=1 Tax=Amborella trichopoda TaxID=13333 RepID=W1Q064_AMBTC|nr:hypothetical protein AMTR_s00021p00039690 [Amborella trichopoda]
MVGGPHAAFLENALHLSFVGHSHPQRNDVKGIQRWAIESWDVSELLCQKISSADLLFSFPLEESFRRALKQKSPLFHEVALSLDGAKKWVLQNPKRSGYPSLPHSPPCKEDRHLWKNRRGLWKFYYRVLECNHLAPHYLSAF